MKVELINYTPRPDWVVATAMRQSHSVDPVLSTDKIAHLIATAYKLGHYSVFEHAYFTFNVSGISRVCSHQFVRHRHLSFVQQSQRYTNADNFVTPEGLKGFTAEYYNILKQAINLYNQMIYNGVKKEDARFVLPQAVGTTLTVSGNARAWMHFLKLRTDKAAQWEIRNVAWEIFRLLNSVAPVIFDIKYKSFWEG